ncbi:MAG TPA: filamentous hemagglutinin N-terminal domain-containing protein [Nitrospira sp.]|nr:filamentous hemagglutinin N-terminal domain-containing protein [Nitrospira sp.]
MYDSPIHKTARAPKTGPASFAFSEPLPRRHRILCGLLAAVQLLIPSLTLALPTDGRVAGGGATLQSTSKSITIQQTTDKAILNWKSFSIAADEAVHFRQPSADSIALNRVIGGDPSVIFGRLQANGRIFLLNPNGILFGAGAQLNVGGLLASTLHTRDEEFMAGRYLFAQDPLKGLKTVVNQGTLQVSEHGFVILAAPAVSNEGIIVANLGTTVLGSGQQLTVDLMGDGLINYALTGKVLEQVTGIDGTASGSAVKNSGTIHADGGQVILQASAAGDIFSSVVNQSGVIRARSLTHEDGIVRLDGGDSGQVTLAGTIDASGPASGQTGGRVSLLGESVTLTPTARIDVSGAGGGGTALIGGQFQGRGTEPTATTTLVADRASISTDALTQGTGGTVIVWADGHTQYAGTISAQGGASGGHGGFVEVSGKQALDFTGRVDTTAPAGHTGTLLLDPSNITISSAANANISAAPTFTGTTATSTLNVTTLQTALATNNVIVDTTSPFASAGNITVSNAVTWSSANSLDLRAHNTITVNAGLSSTGLGILRLIGDQDGIGGGNVALNAAISARLGGIEISGDGITSGTAGTLTTTGLASGDAGHITINATGAVNLRGAVTANGGTAGVDTSGRTGGTVAITGAGVTTGTLTASGSNGNGADQPGGAGGTLSLTSTNGVTTGALTASGGNAGPGAAAGGQAGSLAVTNSTAGNLTVGALTARTGNASGASASGPGGTVTITQHNAAAGVFLQTGAISTVGGSNGDGGTVTLSSQSGVQFATAATIQTTGGTAGRAGGDLTITGRTVTTTGALTTSGSNGNGADQPGGQAGALSITAAGTVTTSAGALTASGGNAGTGNAAGGPAGALTVTNTSPTTGNVTTGALTSRTGNASGAGLAGTAGTVSVTQTNATAGATLQTGAINTSGGTQGAGGAVVLDSMGHVTVTSTITTTGGAVGTDQAGGQAGVVAVTGTGTVTTTAGVTTSTGAATGTGPGGGAGSITLTGTAVTAGALTTTGGSNGAGGAVALTSTAGATTLTTVTTSGGTALAGTAGRPAGSLTLASADTLTATTLTASGSNGNGADQPGGAGGTLSLTSTGGHVRVGTISAIGGHALAGNADGGNGGSVSLDAGGATPTITHQTVTTTGGNRIGSGTAGTGGDISVADASLLSAATTIAAGGGSAGAGTGGHVTFGDTVDSSGSNRTLAVNTNGITTFIGAVGETFALTSLATDAPGSVRVGGHVTTTGVQTYNDPLTLLAHSTMTGTTPTFGSTLTGGGFDLTLNFSGTTVINGAAFTGINQFVSGNGGTTSLTGAFSTTGAQTFGDAVTLAGNTTLTSSGNHDITFNSTVNGARALAVNTTGTTTFGGSVGTTTALTSLTTDSGGTTALNGGGAVTTSGNQTYNDAVTMNQFTTVTSTGGAITFAEQATNTLAGAGLTIDAPTLSLTSGKTVATTGNGPIRFLTNSFNPNGANIDAGTGAFTLSPTTLTNTIEFGDVNTARVTTVYYGSLFGSLTAGSFTIGRATHRGNIFVTGVATAPSSLQIVNGGTGSVTFENAPYVSGNQPLGVTGGTGGITIGQDLTLGTGTLRLTTTGAISQTAGTLIAETAGLSAASGITLAQPLNDVVTLAARTATGDLTFTNNNGFTIGGVTATADGFHPAVTGVSAGGAIILQSGGAVTQTQRILGSSLRLQGSGPFTLTDNANEVTTFSATTSDHVQYTDATDVILGTSSIPGNFDLTTSGAITQSGALTVTGRTTLAAGASDITLTQAGNNFSRIDITSANHVALTDSDALVLGASTFNGTLDITTNGALTQNGALTVGGAATLASGSYDITLIDAGNDFTSVSITGGNHVSLRDTNALRLATSTITGNLHADAGNVTIGGALTSSGGNLTLTGVNSVTQLAHLSVTGAHTITVTAPSGPLTMAPTATSTSDTGAIAYAAGADITLGSLHTGTGVNVMSSGGSVLSAAGSGMNIIAGANSSLRAFNGVVGTQAAPITVHVSAGTLGIHATAARFGISAFLNGTVLPGQALTMLNVPPGLVCFNACRFGTIPSFNVASAIPWYMRHASNPLWYSILSTYLPEDVVEGTPMDVYFDEDRVAREIPPCTPAGACAPKAAVLTPPSSTEDPTAY